MGYKTKQNKKRYIVQKWFGSMEAELSAGQDQAGQFEAGRERFAFVQDRVLQHAVLSRLRVRGLRRLVQLLLGREHRRLLQELDQQAEELVGEQWEFHFQAHSLAPARSSRSHRGKSKQFFLLLLFLRLKLILCVTCKELSNITINDPKSYAGCQSLSSSNRGDDQEATCGDQLAEFTSPYVMTDLVPMTSYQFRIELMTAFGKSRVYMTETVQVPFELRPLMVAFRGGASDTQYSLKCATPLLDAAKLKFAWLKNDQRLRDDDKSTYEILAPAVNL